MDGTKVPFLTLFVAIWLMYCISTTMKVDACSCMPSHPQTHYCNSDFVILARIKRRSVPINGTVAYKVRVRKEYKLSEKAAVALKSGKLLTPSDESMCGVRLVPGKLYALSGRIHSLKAYISLCDMFIVSDQLTKRQRRGLKALYKHGCDKCKINFCRFDNCKSSHTDSCNFDSLCQLGEGICLRQRSGKCGWNKNRALLHCLKN